MDYRCQMTLCCRGFICWLAFGWLLGTAMGDRSKYHLRRRPFSASSPDLIQCNTYCWFGVWDQDLGHSLVHHFSPLLIIIPLPTSLSLDSPLSHLLSPLLPSLFSFSSPSLLLPLFPLLFFPSSPSIFLSMHVTDTQTRFHARDHVQMLDLSQYDG